MNNDTIAAISTPLGTGGIGIVRISGSEAISFVSRIIKSRKKLNKIESNKLQYCKIINPKDNEIIDEAMIVVMRSPQSYTGEDVVEINAHGNTILLRRIMRLLLDIGVRYAGPGEFTKRAFLNGKIDLLQAESIADIIAAKTELSGKIAANKLFGTLTYKLDKIKEQMIEIISLIETDIEFSEDADIDFLEIKDKAGFLIKEMEKLVENSGLYNIFNEGIKIVITGPTNVGKSSLLNLLTQREKAIVTEIPGTTRDVIEAQVSIDGIPIILFDTAGIREEYGAVEAEGIKRTFDMLDVSEIILLLVDVSQKFDESIYEAFKEKNMMVLLNKIDLVDSIEVKQYEQFFKKSRFFLPISAKTGAGFKDFIKVLKKRINGGEINIAENNFILNDRQTFSIKAAIKSMNIFISDINEDKYPELLAVSLKEAIFRIDEVLGKNVDERILENIFSNFCIGK